MTWKRFVPIRQGQAANAVMEPYLLVAMEQLGSNFDILLGISISRILLGLMVHTN